MSSRIAASRPSLPAPLARRLIPLAVLVALVVVACSGGSTASPVASLAPAPSTGSNPAMEALAKTIPTEVGGITLTVGSGDLSYLGDKLPGYDQLTARLANAGVTATDVIVALGRPASGGMDPTVAGLSVLQAPPGGLGLLALMDAWTSEIPGATTETTNIGKPVVKVSFSDGSAPLYYYLFGDSTMYWVRTADEALAEDALKQLP